MSDDKKGKNVEKIDEIAEKQRKEWKMTKSEFNKIMQKQNESRFLKGHEDKTHMGKIECGNMKYKWIWGLWCFEDECLEQDEFNKRICIGWRPLKMGIVEYLRHRFLKHYVHIGHVHVCGEEPKIDFKLIDAIHDCGYMIKVTEKSLKDNRLYCHECKTSNGWKAV